VGGRSRVARLIVGAAVAALLGGCAATSSSLRVSPVATNGPPSAAAPSATVAPSAAAAAPTATPALPTETATASPTEEPTTEPIETGEPTPTPLPTPTPRPTSGPDLAISAATRASADPAAAKTAASSVNAFGLDFFRQLLADSSQAQKNTVFSPTSIALALAMARAGAKGETASQIDAVLHTSGWEQLGPGLNSLSQALASRDGTWTDALNVEHSLALRIGNAAYGQQGWEIERPYLDAIAAAFGAGLHLLDFAADPEGARKTINAWVSDQTNGRIPELLSSDDINPSTLFVLVNAIYLNANWEWEFYESDTKPAPFTRLDGSRVEVPTMHRSAALLDIHAIPYASGAGWQATELRYRAPEGSSQLAMTLVLPADLAAFEKTLTASKLGAITTALAAQWKGAGKGVPCSGALAGYAGECYPYDLSLFLPRFAMETRADLGDALTALGMPLAFGSSADFSGIHTPNEISISTAVHQANIDVNEKGTEAAAATALGGYGGTEQFPPRPLRQITLRLDHPFVFFVRDLETGAVLFMGQATDPSAAKGG